jgi:hypothetical protein
MDPHDDLDRRGRAHTQGLRDRLIAAGAIVPLGQRFAALPALRLDDAGRRAAAERIAAPDPRDHPLDNSPFLLEP